MLVNLGQKLLTLYCCCLAAFYVFKLLGAPDRKLSVQEKEGFLILFINILLPCKTFVLLKGCYYQ